MVDALLGAAGRGDIGQRFPSSEPRYRDADSRSFVGEVVAELRADGWAVANLDATVIAQSPRLAPHAEAIRASLAELLGVEPQAVGFKAKTADHLGALGREEGLAALAVVLLEQG